MDKSKTESNTIFKREPQDVEFLKKCRDQAYHHCCKYLHHHVRVQTIDGEIYEGRLMGTDVNHIYLQLVPVATRQYPYYYNPYYPGYNPYGAVLPLVLFNLLAISLI